MSVAAGGTTLPVLARRRDGPRGARRRRQPAGQVPVRYRDGGPEAAGPLTCGDRDGETGFRIGAPRVPRIQVRLRRRATRRDPAGEHLSVRTDSLDHRCARVRGIHALDIGGASDNQHIPPAPPNRVDDAAQYEVRVLHTGKLRRHAPDPIQHRRLRDQAVLARHQRDAGGVLDPGAEDLLKILLAAMREDPQKNPVQQPHPAPHGGLRRGQDAPGRPPDPVRESRYLQGAALGEPHQVWAEPVGQEPAAHRLGLPGGVSTEPLREIAQRRGIIASTRPRDGGAAPPRVDLGIKRVKRARGQKHPDRPLGQGARPARDARRGRPQPPAGEDRAGDGIAQETRDLLQASRLVLLRRLAAPGAECRKAPTRTDHRVRS